MIHNHFTMIRLRLYRLEGRLVGSSKLYMSFCLSILFVLLFDRMCLDSRMSLLFQPAVGTHYSILQI